MFTCSEQQITQTAATHVCFTRRHQTCHFRKRATSAPAEGPAYGLDFARHCYRYMNLSLSLSLCIYIYTYMYIYMYIIHTHVCIYIYREREIFHPELCSRRLINGPRVTSLSTRQTFIHIHQTIFTVSNSEHVYCILNNWCLILINH